MIAALPRRDRAVMLSALALLTVVSWAYLWYLAAGAMALCSVEFHAWRLDDLLASFAMWAVMMGGMMIPSASPAILTFAAVNRARRTKSLSYAPAAAFAAGYLSAWTAFSVAASVAQEALRAAALLSPMMVSESRTLGRIVLIAAGVFQWTPLKNACLRHCRSPLGFLLTEWREGWTGALRMGWRHGFFCVGCCWLLMAVLFVVGVMNLWWIAAVSAFVLIEKLAPSGLVAARIAGIAMIGCALWLVR
jgi:predicted metal-binding membrane protein